MLRENSPTLQKMIASVKPGEGNMQTAQVSMPGQFQSPYPSPKDMVMQVGMANPYYGYAMPSYSPMPGYPQYPYPGYPMPTPMPAYGMAAGFQTPANTIAMINGVPTELEFKPEEVGSPTAIATTTYKTIPGAPTNPDLAHLEGKTEYKAITPQPGRYMPVPSNVQPGQYRVNMMNQQPNLVGAYRPGYMVYGGFNNLYQMQPAQMSIPTNPSRGHQDVIGAVDVYNGQLIHPHVNAGWYGSVNFPFAQNSKVAMANATTNMRQKFMERFPGYSNPYAPPGFMQTPQRTIPPEIQDMANIAAFYGMTYDQFINNGSKMMKLMSRHANKYFGADDEEIKKKQKLYDVKYPRDVNSAPEKEDDLFYPNGAFDFRGQLTKEYQETFCVSQDRMEKVRKLKVKVVYGDKEVKCPKRRISFAQSRDMLEKWFMADRNYNMWLMNNRYKFAQYYWAAPERRIDHISGNVFEVTSSALAYAEQVELERKLVYQNSTRSASTFNRADYISTIKGILQKNRANKKEIDQRKWHELIHKVAGPKQGQEPSIQQAPLYQDRPYICDGDWVIAKPGVDIVGLPLDQSVNKIIRMNTVTGEEEIYDPSKMTGFDVRERIKESINPSFNEIDEDELEKRLSRFELTEFKDF